MVHLETSELVKSPNGTVLEQWTSEFWFDPDTREARYEQRDADGTLHVQEAHSGLSDSVFYPEENHVETLTAPSDSAVEHLPGFVDNVENQVYGYKNAILSQKLMPQPVRDGERIFRDHLGQVYEIVQVEVPYGHEGDAEMDLIKAWLDVKTLLPLREVGYRYGELGGLVELDTHLIAYTLIEDIPRSQLPANFFALEGPSVQTVTNQRFMSALTATAFKEFDIYWLGPTGAGLPLNAIYHNESVSPSGRLSQIGVIYGSDEVPSEMLSIRQRTPPTAEETGNRGEPGRTDPGEAVTVGGRRAALYEDGTGRVELELTIGATFITIGGKSRDQLLQSAQLLLKLN